MLTGNRRFEVFINAISTQITQITKPTPSSRKLNTSKLHKTKHETITNEVLDSTKVCGRLKLFFLFLNLLTRRWTKILERTSTEYVREEQLKMTEYKHYIDRVHATLNKPSSGIFKQRKPRRIRQALYDKFVKGSFCLRMLLVP